MSEAVERKLVALLGNPTTSPYGNPIPGLDRLGVGDPAPPVEADLRRLDDVARTGGGTVEICRIAEHVQLDPDLMADLKAAGVLPGREIRVSSASRADQEIVLSGGESDMKLAPTLAHAVLVRVR